MPVFFFIYWLASQRVPWDGCALRTGQAWPVVEKAAEDYCMSAPIACGRLVYSSVSVRWFAGEARNFTYKGWWTTVSFMVLKSLLLSISLFHQNKISGSTKNET